jgi:hypothetical protein
MENDTLLAQTEIIELSGPAVVADTRLLPCRAIHLKLGTKHSAFTAHRAAISHWQALGTD